MVNHGNGVDSYPVYNPIHVDLPPRIVLARIERSLEKPEFVLSQKPPPGGFFMLKYLSSEWEIEGRAWIKPGKLIRGTETRKSFKAEALPGWICR